jgi:hypothetical protein
VAGAAVTLPAVTVPFAVRASPEVRPDLWPLDRPVPPHVDDAAPPTLVRLDTEVPELVAAAREAVTRDAGPWTSSAAELDPGRAAAAGIALGTAVARAVPQLLVADASGLAVPGTGCRVLADGALERVSVPGTTGVDTATAHLVAPRLDAVRAGHRALEAVALAVAEDVVLVDADARAVWLHVCAPSGWDPGSAGGRPLTELHAPVPAADRLRAASRALGRAIVATGPHVRWVWGLTDDPAAAHHPRRRGPASLGDLPIGRLTFRAERQTTLPLPDLDLGVFLIRVHRAPLDEVVTTADRARHLAAAVRALPDDLAAYKGVADRRDELLAWLDAVGHAAPPPQ